MNFFLTCGRGTEEFAANECRRLFEHSKVTFRDGKVFLGIEFVDKENEMIDKLVRLKTAERLFVSMKHAPDFQLISFRQVTTQLKSLIQSITSWQRHFELCVKLKSAIKSNSSWPANRAPDIQVKPEANAVVSPSSSGEQKSAGEQSHPSLSCGNLTSDSDNAKTSEQTRDRSDHSRNFPNSERKRQNMDSVVTFRVSAKCSGPACRHFSSQSLSQFLGREIAHATGWIPDLRRPQCEIYAQLNHEGCVIGLPVNSNPLSNRPYIRHAGLRTTIASIMVTLADVEPGYCLLDPMCGEATILLEASKAKDEHNEVLCIGCDIDAEQCRRASENVAFAGETGSVQILRADITNLPFPDSAFDAVICDVPFGNKHGTVESVRRLMGPLVSSINRVVKEGCKVVLLVGAETKSHLLEVVKNMRRCDVLSDTSSATVTCSSSTSAAADDSSWSTDLVRYVKLGETDAFVCCFTKKT